MIEFDSLVIELSRKCNYKCRHCLRGNSQNKVMSNEMIYKTLQGIDYINSLTIGGGEPSLACDQIEYLLDCVQMLNVDVGNFYIVTNGHRFNRRFRALIQRFYNICTKNEISGLAISDDEFHREFHRSNWEYNVARYYIPEEYWGEYDCWDIEDIGEPWSCSYHDKQYKNAFRGILDVGNAHKNGIGEVDINERIYQPKKEIYDEDINIRGDVYVSLKGDVLPCCDLSYKLMDSGKYTIGNIMTESWEDIVSKLEEE